MSESSISLDSSESITRDVVLEELQEKIQDLQRLSLRPVVLLYEKELVEFRRRMKFASAVPGEVCKKRVELWTDEIQDLDTCISQLLRGATEK